MQSQPPGAGRQSFPQSITDLFAGRASFEAQQASPFSGGTINQIEGALVAVQNAAQAVELLAGILSPILAEHVPAAVLDNLAAADHHADDVAGNLPDSSLEYVCRALRLRTAAVAGALACLHAGVRL